MAEIAEVSLTNPFDAHPMQERLTDKFSQRYKSERRAVEAKREFDTVTKLIKVEMARFEGERVEDFKIALEQFLLGMIRKQKTVRFRPLAQ